MPYAGERRIPPIYHGLPWLYRSHFWLGIDYEADDNPFEGDCDDQLVTVEPALAVSVFERILKTAKAIRKSPQQRANFEIMAGLACSGDSKANCLILDVS